MHRSGGTKPCSETFLVLGEGRSFLTGETQLRPGVAPLGRAKNGSKDHVHLSFTAAALKVQIKVLDPIAT